MFFIKLLATLAGSATVTFLLLFTFLEELTLLFESPGTSELEVPFSSSSGNAHAHEINMNVGNDIEPAIELDSVIKKKP